MPHRGTNLANQPDQSDWSCPVFDRSLTGLENLTGQPDRANPEKITLIVELPFPKVIIKWEAL